MKNRIYIIGGPTASGKSAVAIQRARALGNAVILNADSMQVYAGLPVLSAQPSVAEMADIPHRLYGYIPANEKYSVQRWLQDVTAEIRTAWAAGQTPIVVGGTGMYLTSLMLGLHPIPDIDPQVRVQAQQRLDVLGHAAFHMELAVLDSESAAKIPPGDTQRMLRAWEVATGTGTPLSVWQQGVREQPLPEADIQGVRLNPPREVLYARCNARLVQMVQCGALEEVERLMAQGIPADAPITNTLGYLELCAHLRGEMPLALVLEKAMQKTRNFAKRQVTWFTNQLGELTAVSS